MRRALSALALFAALGLTGCGGDKPKVETFEAPPADPLAEAKAILNNYANGQPVASEAAAFPEIVRRVRAADPAKGDVLDKGFKDILANKQNPGPKAKEILKKL